MAFIRKYKKYLRISALIWTVFLAISILFFIFVIYPQFQERDKTAKELIESRLNYEMAQKASLDETKTSIKEEVELLQGKLHSFVLDYKSSADLTFEMSRIADESKVSSFNIQSNDMKDVSGTADPNNIFEKCVKISFTADFRAFAEFLNSLERHQPVLFINEFSLNRQSNDSTTYQVTINAVALVQKQQAAVTKAEKPETELFEGEKFQKKS